MTKTDHRRVANLLNALLGIQQELGCLLFCNRRLIEEVRLLQNNRRKEDVREIF